MGERHRWDETGPEHIPLKQLTGTAIGAAYPYTFQSKFFKKAIYIYILKNLYIYIYLLKIRKNYDYMGVESKRCFSF